MAGQPFAAWRARVGAQRLDTGDQAPPIALPSDPLKFLGRGAFDLEAISFHAASGP
jgi:hypothetical protein